MNNYYIRIDCDNVGDKIEFALYNNAHNEAQRISDKIKDNITWLIRKVVEEFSAEILLIGSDDILFKINEFFFDIHKIEELRQEFYKRSNITLSIGIGNTTRQSHINLKIAKVSGKDKIIS